MRIAIAIWNSRVSPVFDVSRTVLLCDIESGKLLASREEALGDTTMAARAQLLADLRVETLVCGAISDSVAALVRGHGIEIVAFVAGEVSQVIKAYLEKGLPHPAMSMPGCGQGAGQGGGRCRGRGGGRGHGGGGRGQGGGGRGQGGGRGLGSGGQ